MLALAIGGSRDGRDVRSNQGTVPPDATNPTSGTETRLLRTEAYGALLALFAVVLLLALVTFDPADAGKAIGSDHATRNLLGPMGAHMAQLFLWAMGLGAFAVDGLLGYVGVKAVVRRPVRMRAGPVVWTLVAAGMLLVFLHVVAPRDARVLGAPPGGVVGRFLGEVAIALFSRAGAGIVSGSVLVIAGAALAGRSLGGLLRTGAGLAWTGIWRAGRAVGAGVGRVLSWARARLPARSGEGPRGEPGARGGPELEGLTRVGVRRIATRSDPVEVEPYWVRASVTRTDVRPGGAVTTPETERGPVAPATGAAGEATGLQRTTSRAADEAWEATARAPRIVVTRPRRTGVQEDLPLGPLGGHAHPYTRPTLSLLDFVEARASPVDRDLLRRNAETLERKLMDYRVEGRVVEIHPGPVVTMYEFLPAPGVKISQIANLEDDLTMALEAMSIRIVAPIPGKGVVGIEVPNVVRETVYLREILASEAFTKSRGKLTLALGKDIFGTPMVTDLSRMPHLLIAGATGSGKSVAVNAFLMSLLYNATPEEVRIVLVDPKVVELQVYEGVPHLLLPVVYDPKHAAAALRWAVEEMERRYELLARLGTRNIQSYNQRVERLAADHPLEREPDEDADEAATSEAPALEERTGEDLRRLPYLVIVLDEFADLMMVASKEVETAVARLAQKARAAGIHLIMATQRPSKEVITGLIKANFTCRISFRVSSKIDSRIILDQNGAEALLGYGDMLFLRPGTSVLTRVHGPYVSEEEVQRVVTYLKAQGQPEYNLDILQAQAGQDEEEDPKDLDPLLDEAIGIVLEDRRASISYLQRRLKVGYNRAARIMEQIERRGIVGPPDSRGERQVLT